MKKGILLAAGLCIIFSFLGNQAKATHAAGGELVYEWVSDSTYRFIFKFYRDCGGAGEPNSVVLCAKNTCTNQNYSRTMFKLSQLPGGGSNGQQVSTGCANQKNKCDSLQSSIPGYREWWYVVEFTLPAACSNWVFSAGIANRNSSDNLQNSSDQVFYVETRFNSVAAPGNSSPIFSVKPVPYVCLNQNYQYNNGGVDPDNDSVVFDMVMPLAINNPNNCALSPFNTTFAAASPSYNITNNPFQTNNTFTINPLTGELDFTPGMQGSHTVTIRAQEYRNGVVIGSVMRDIQVQVIPCATSSITPTISNDSVSVTGAATYSGGTVVGCATKQFSFCFNIKSTDTAAKLVATDNHGVALPGSSISYTNLQTDSVRGCVTWTPAPTDTGTRVFVVTVKDSSCASGGVPISYAITVPVYVWAVTAALKDTTICAGQSVPITAVGGTAYIWSVVSGGSPLTSLSCTQCKTPIASPTVTTSYVVNSNSSQTCNQNTDTVTVTVLQLPVASATSNSPVCPGDTLKLFGNTVTGATYSWTGPNGFTSTLQNPVIPNAQSVNSGFYLYRLIRNGCTSEPFVMQVYAGPPAGPVASSNSPVCLGNQLILTATTVPGTTVTYHWSGPNSFTSNQQNPIINNATYADSGNYIVYATKDGCVTFSDTVNIKVNGLPAAPVATVDTVTYCQDATAAALTATGTNLKWYTVPTGGTGSSPFTPPTTNAGTFTYYVSQTDGNGCEGPRDSVKVIITAKPANPGVTSNLAYCQGATIPALTATGTNLKWYTTPFGGTPLSGAPVPSSATPGNTTFYVSQTSTTTGCESDRTPITVTIYATPAAPATASPVSYCVGGPVAPALSTLVIGSNILWYTDSTGGTGSSTPPSISTATAMTDTFYVTQTLNTCESPRAMLIVVVNAIPAPPQTADTSYCQFATTAALTATGQNLLWYTAATGGSGSPAAPVPSAANPGVFKYYVSQTVNGCESPRDSIAVTIYAQPQPPVGHDDSVCQFSTPAPLTATGVNLRWYSIPVGGTGSFTPPTPATTTPGTYFWYVSQQINGCESERDTIEIEIVPKPVPPQADTTEFCLNATPMPLTAVGQNLLWYNVPVGGTATQIAPTPNTSLIGVTHYYVSQTIDGCESDRDTLTVIVDTSITARITLSDSMFCVYDSVIVTQTGQLPDTSNFTWTWSGGIVLSGDSSGPYVVKWDSAGIKTITLNVDNNGCKAADTTTLEVLPQPEAYFNMPPEVCVGSETIFRLDTVLLHAVGYNWVLDPRVGIKDVDTTLEGFTIIWKEPGSHTFSLRTISQYGCVSSEATDTVNVRDYPVVRIEPVSNNTICINSTITLNAQQLSGVSKFEWSPIEKFMTNTGAEVSARIHSSGYIRLTAEDAYGCRGSDSLYLGVKLCCKAILPSAFSPNNDGLNDKFGIISNGRYKIYDFRVVNRYGRVVFSTTNQNDRWDGTYNGTPQGMGTYYYYIRYTCEDDDADNMVEERGDVTLVK